MLTELQIENFAIIHKLELKFSAGLTAFTGETGAGKSIILDALEAVMGGRSDSTHIRSGADRALVEATFRIPEQNRIPIHEILTREALLDDTDSDSDFVIMGRELRREGRNIARINGRNVNVSLLREIGEYLVDIHGQSEHLSLLNIKRHLGLLDSFAGSEPYLEAYRVIYKKVTQTRKELQELRKSEHEAAQRMDLLNFQIQEIENAELKPDEEEELRQERTRLANAEKLASLVQKCLILLEEGDTEVPAISDLLGQAAEAIINLSKIDSAQEKLSEQVVTLAEGLSDVTTSLQDYQEKIEFNPRRLEEVEIRLDLINTLKRKYGNSIDTILAYLAKARSDLENITHAEERIKQLAYEEQNLLKQLAQEGLKLSDVRRKAAETLSKGVETELVDLSMARARFTVDMQYRSIAGGLSIAPGQTVYFDETGLDQVQFLIAPNPGEGFKPLVKIASGGETSRLMLALKNVLAKADQVATLVFDEIDQGIGGRIGGIVGEKLWQLARQHQVLCITHLPQLAAFGDQHYCVLKQIEAGRTLTVVTPLEGEARLNELAQMIGSQSKANLNAAQESLELCAFQGHSTDQQIELSDFSIGKRLIRP